MNKLVYQALGGAVLLLAGAFVWRKLTGGNDLEAYYNVENDLQSMGTVSNQAHQISQQSVPLAEIGQTPLAGIHIDPFDPDGIGSRMRNIVFNQSVPTDRIAKTLGNWLRAPDVKN